MPKKKQYNNPYYLELLKALVARKATKAVKNTVPVENLRYLSNKVYGSEYLLKVMPVNGVTKKTAYSLSENSLNHLFSYIIDYFPVYKGCTMAYESANKSFFYFDKCKFETDMLEIALIHYIIFKTATYLDRETEGKLNGKFAYHILKNSIRKNYCLFDYWEVLADLETNLLNFN